MDHDHQQRKPRILSYRDLTVWRAGMDLVVESYQVARRLPRSEMFGLARQIQGAAVSIPANIAEGHGRAHRGDYARFVSIAVGSLKELETHIHVARRLGFVAARDVAPLLRAADELGRMLASLARRLRSPNP